MTVRILIGDCRERMAELPDASVDSCVCDPPYHLTSIVKRFGRSNMESAAEEQPPNRGAQYKRLSRGFMGQQWDGGDVAFQPETWAEVLRVLKPGAHLVAFSGTRTYHRMACAIEDAGFEIRDQLAWIYGSGFPKSHDVSKGIDKLLGGERPVIGDKRDLGIWHAQKCSNESKGIYGDKGGHLLTGPGTEAAAQWQGWGTALKPAWEPICLARKPLESTVARNVLAHGTGALNIDGCRIEARGRPLIESKSEASVSTFGDGLNGSRHAGQTDLGRWPANIIHDGSDEVLAGFPSESGGAPENRSGSKSGGIWSESTGAPAGPQYADSGSAARFFYCAKATTEERGQGNNHPTVKPIDLMRWLCRLVTPKGGTVLDPFSGSGSTLIAADAEQFNAIGCELSPDYAAIAERRVRASAGMFAEVLAA